MPEDTQTTTTTANDDTVAQAALADAIAAENAQNAAAAQTATTQPATEWDGKIDSLPAGVQKIIADLRKEAGDHRTGKNAAETKLQAILQAAGVGQEDDPVKLLETRTSELQTATDARDSAVRDLAIFRAAHDAGADAVKLLDRNSFMTSVAGLDPADGAALKAAIDAAVKADPTLKTIRAVGASSVDNSGGTGELGQITEEQLRSMTPEQIVDAQKKGLLNALLS